MAKGKGGGRNAGLKKMIVDAILSANDPATAEVRRVISANSAAQKKFADTVGLAPGGYEITDPKTGTNKQYLLQCKAKRLGKKPLVVCAVPTVKGDKSLRKMLNDFAARFGRIERYAEKHGGLDGIRSKGRKKACKGRGRTKAGKCRKARKSRR